MVSSKAVLWLNGMGTGELMRCCPDTVVKTDLASTDGGSKVERLRLDSLAWLFVDLITYGLKLVVLLGFFCCSPPSRRVQRVSVWRWTVRMDQRLQADGERVAMCEQIQLLVPSLKQLA